MPIASFISVKLAVGTASLLIISASERAKAARTTSRRLRHPVAISITTSATDDSSCCSLRLTARYKHGVSPLNFTWT